MHRGPHPQDAELFAPSAVPLLQAATGDLCWLLSRGYASVSALKLVGDRYNLSVRQRTAIGRCACSDADRQDRQERRVEPTSVTGHAICVDGYNVLTTVEAALSGGVLLAGRDGALRDMASMHGSFRKVAETHPALELIAQSLMEWQVSVCRWYFDRPVSNSGRLKVVIEELAARGRWPWLLELVPNPDRILSETDQIVATADSAVLQRCRAWLNLGQEVVRRHVPEAWIIELPGREGN